MLLIFGTLRLFMMISNLFVIANVKQLRTDGSFRILLPFFQTSWSVGVLNSAIFNNFQFGLSLVRFWRAFGISGGGGFETPPPKPPRSVRYWSYGPVSSKAIHCHRNDRNLVTWINDPDLLTHARINNSVIPCSAAASNRLCSQWHGR